MNELEFTFEKSPLDDLLETLAEGQTLSAAQLLTVSEGEDEQALEDAFDRMEEQNISLDISDLETPAASERIARRLQLEEKFVREGMHLQRLEEGDPLRLFLEELAGIPACGDVVLLAQQLSEANRAGTDAQQLRETLLELSLSRVVELAATYAGKGVQLLDLVQEGSMGLLQGMERFCGEGSTFEASRDRWIRMNMEKMILYQAQAAGVGQKLRRLMEDYRSVDEKLLAELGRNPEPEELAQGLHLSVQETLQIAQLVDNTRQMHRTVTPEPEDLPQEEDQAVEDTAYFQMRQRISELLSMLTGEDARLLTLRYGLEGGLPMKPQQVAQRLGITAEEVVAREAAALSKLRTTKE